MIRQIARHNQQFYQTKQADSVQRKFRNMNAVRERIVKTQLGNYFDSREKSITAMEKEIDPEERAF